MMPLAQEHFPKGFPSCPTHFQFRIHLPPTDWLTERLRTSGALPGTVRTLGSRTNASFNSAITHLEPTYSPGAPEAPRNIILKRSLPVAWARECGAMEVRFYRMVARLTDHPPITVRCYDAAIDPETGDSFLLLEDLTPTHVAPQTRDEQITRAPSLPSPWGVAGHCNPRLLSRLLVGTPGTGRHGGPNRPLVRERGGV